MSTWRYMRNGQPFGPVETADLQALLNNGTLTGDTLVAPGTTENWAPVRTIAEFIIPTAQSTGSSASTQAGTAVPPSMAPLSDADAADIEQNKVYAVLAYLGPLFLVPLLAAPKSKFARYHTNQGIVLFLATIVGFVASSILAMVPIVGCLVFWAPFVVGLGAFIFIILGIINAASGETKPLPWIGQYRILS